MTAAPARSYVFADATTADRDQIIAISAITMREHQARSPEDFPPGGEDTVADEIDQYFHNPQREVCMPFARLIVLRDGTRVVGHALLKFGQVAVSGQAQDMSCHIADISLHPDFRGQGLGKALLEKIESVCHDEGASTVHGHVWRGNLASEKLFENASFQTAAKVFAKRFRAPYLPPAVQETRSAVQNARNAMRDEAPVETSEVLSFLPFLLIGAVLLFLVSTIMS